MTALALLTGGFVVVWQFAQFALFTQLCSLYALRVAGIVSARAFETCIRGLVVSLHLKINSSGKAS